MTSKQINNLSDVELIEAYKQKRCSKHSVNTYTKLYRELLIRQMPNFPNPQLLIAISHIQIEGPQEFFDEMDKIKQAAINRNLFPYDI